MEPEAVEPEAMQPDAMPTGPVEPEAVEPEDMEPEAMVPEAMVPEDMEPEAMEPGNPQDELDEVRQYCVDYINMKRATIDLPPLRRANPEQESCSDDGAKKDGDSGRAHGSAGDCRRVGLYGSQNTCPGYPVGGRRASTLMDALRVCLDQMWAEGEPPEGFDACIADRTGCFLRHGHYINMVNNNGIVACGFYEMDNGRWWMNQNFGR